MALQEFCAQPDRTCLYYDEVAQRCCSSLVHDQTAARVLDQRICSHAKVGNVWGTMEADKFTPQFPGTMPLEKSVMRVVEALFP